MGGIFSFGAMAVGGGNVAVGLGFGSTVVVNVIDVVCPFCFCSVLGGGVGVRLTEVGNLLSIGKSCVGEDLEGVLIFKISFRASTMDLANFSFPFSDR